MRSNLPIIISNYFKSSICLNILKQYAEDVIFLTSIYMILFTKSIIEV